ncbi:MAG: hypothetical protein ACO3GL_02575 [Bacteroidia bacterium]
MAALFVGSIFNMSIIWIGGQVIPAPAGHDLSTPAGFEKALPLLTPLHFLFPFLAHALGTLSGAILVSWLKPKETRKYALIIGIIFLIGGIMACFMIPAPGWFMATDLMLAYIPMALLGEYFFNRLAKP